MYSYLIGDFIGSAFEDVGSKGAEDARLFNQHLAHSFTDDSILALTTCFWLLTPGAVEHQQNLDDKLQEFASEHIEKRFDAHLLQYFRWPQLFKKSKLSVSALASIAIPIGLWGESEAERKSLIEMATGTLTTHPKTVETLKEIAEIVHDAFWKRDANQLKLDYLKRHPESLPVFEMEWEQLKREHPLSIEIETLLPVCLRIISEHQDYTTVMQKLFSLGGLASSEGALISILWEGIHGDLDAQFSEKILTQPVFLFDFRILSLLKIFLEHERLAPLHQHRKTTPIPIRDWVQKNIY